MNLASGYVWRWQWIANLCRTYGWTRGAELGVKEGRTTSYLLGKEPALHMTAVDLWDQCPPNALQTYSSWNWTEIIVQFHRATSPYAARLLTLKMSTQDAAEECRRLGLIFDFVFFDADHSYEGLKADIQAWKDLVRSGGWFLGHDMDVPSVMEAVREEFPTARTWQKGDNGWWSVKP